MPDTTTAQPADDGDRALVRFEEVADQLRDPHAILANALLRIHQADDVQAELDALDDTEPFGWQSTRLGERQHFLTDSAKALTDVARIASDLALRERDEHERVQWEDQFGDLAAPADPTPEPVQGMRFSLVVSAPGDGLHMGRVGGRDWFYLPGAGFVDISGADEIDESGVTSYRLTGRIVSATPSQILGVTDDGAGIVLPRSAVREAPEDRR